MKLSDRFNKSNHNFYQPEKTGNDPHIKCVNLRAQEQQVNLNLTEILKAENIVINNNQQCYTDSSGVSGYYSFLFLNMDCV